MKIVLTDNTYDGKVEHKVENEKLGSDLALVFEYLEDYRKSNEEKIKLCAAGIGKKLVWQARVDKIKSIQEKYKTFIEFINYIDSEENAL